MSMLDQSTARRIADSLAMPAKVSVTGALNVYYLNPKFKEIFVSLNAALKELLTRIAAGEEYPDAAWATARKHRVAWQDLQRAYDTHCALPQSQKAAAEAELGVE